MSAATTFYNDPEADDAIRAAEALLFGERNGVTPEEAERQYGSQDNQQDDEAES